MPARLFRFLGCVLIIFFAFTSFGCSREYWAARLSMWKAEGAFSKAYSLKQKKVPYKNRLKYYREACEHFLKAYGEDSSVFTYGRIQEALDACWRTSDEKGQQVFEEFLEQYGDEHPKEVEYGDPGPWGELSY
jgi:hypothetical protein